MLFCFTAGIVWWSSGQHAIAGRPPFERKLERRARAAEKAESRPSTVPKVVSPNPAPSTAPASTNGLRSGNIEIPGCPVTDTLFFNTDGRYSFSYCCEARQARWVAYKLTGSDINGPAKRSTTFRKDPQITDLQWPHASNEDYRGSGFDKGHLLPSADRNATTEANRATFLFSNISPQHPRLNRGVWKSLEEQLRRQMAEFDTLYIVTGGAWSDTVKRYVAEKILVPPVFYKTIVMRRGDTLIEQSYVMPNRAELEKDPAFYRVSLDSVERLTGMRLFPAVRHLLVDTVVTAGRLAQLESNE